MISAVHTFEDVRRALLSMGIRGITSFDPVWSAATSAPSLGNGVLTGSYMTFMGMCYTNIHLAIGSTTTLGTGQYSFTLPIKPVEWSSGATWSGSAVFFDTSAGKFACGLALLGADGVADVELVYADQISGTTGKVGSTTPFAWAAGDEIDVTILYPTGYGVGT